MASITRARKRHVLARRDGKTCAYCLAPFADLDAATLDHIVPRCLFRTMATDHLVLCCYDCNHRKGDRLPLLIALLLSAHAAQQPLPVPEAEVRVLGPVPAVLEAEGCVLQAVPDARVRVLAAEIRVLDAVPAAPEARVHVPATPALTLPAWLLLARLADAQETSHAHDRAHEQTHPDLRDATRHTPRHTPLNGAAHTSDGHPVTPYPTAHTDAPGEAA